jgi:hypothetical protein
MTDDAVVRAFLEAALGPRSGGHMDSELNAAEAIRTAHPDIADASIHAAAALGDADAVERWLAADATLVGARGGPYGWDPLTHLCFSRYLELDRSRAESFHRAAALLLDAGADPRSGFFDDEHGPHQQWESLLYGAAGIAHDAALTRLLLSHGADPNDAEVPYHAPETYDLGALQVLVESGTLTADSLATMLVRKHDWHDLEGVRYLLAHGADPNRDTTWGITPFHQALRRDNGLPIVELALQHGADPTRVMAPRAAQGLEGIDAVRIAAWRGRADVLDLLERHGVPMPADGFFGLLVAATRGDDEAVARLSAAEPEAAGIAHSRGGELLGLAAGNGNVAALSSWLGFGLPVDAVWPDGDGYFEVPQRSTALHVAAWRARHDAVRFLLERGAPVDATDGAGRTALVVAVRACVASYWRDRRQPDSIAALIAAGADSSAITVPTGYEDADRLIVAARA